MEAEYRNEYKYLLNACEASLLKARISALIPADSHAGPQGRYLIRSLYMDDLYDSCYYENEDGVDYRHKIRLRYYNNDPSYIVLEEKSKIHGMTKKEGSVISRQLCESLMRREQPVITPDMEDGLIRLLTVIRLRSFVPKVIVSYERAAFVYPVGNVRITFDENLSSCGEILRFLEPAQGERPLYAKGMSLLEVKWDGVMPSFIERALCIDSISWTAFSKYYNSRRLNSYGGVKI